MTENLGSTGQRDPDANEVPSLIQLISSNQVSGFDSSAQDAKATATQSQHRLSRFAEHGRTPSVSISMPSSPLNTEKVAFANDNGETALEEVISDSSSSTSQAKTNAIQQPRQARFYSQPMPTGAATTANGTVENPQGLHLKNPRANVLKDNTYNSFKTWSGRLEKQLPMLRGRQPQESEPQPESPQSQETEQLPLPVDRYFDALEGPELETLRASEVLVLPEDRKWPFLLRFPISSFGICLGVSSQAILWKTLATSPSTHFLHVTPEVNLILWCISIALVTVIASIYSLKVILYFEAVRREYYHPIRVNFFFAPWISLLFLALGVPPLVAKTLHTSVWYILMTPIFCLELKIYGQWMSGGQRRLSRVANPSNHLSIVGNFVGALLGASMGLKEGPIFFFAVGLAHYTVLFVTLYQRLPTNETLPKELHPVFFLFVAAPSVASMAWAKMQGSFDYGSRIAYFISLFLYFSLAVRVNFFRGFRFSVAWWAYTFPMTSASIATIRYSNEVSNVVGQALSVILSVISTLTVTALLVTTIIHALVLRDLFPNDIAIAISERRPKTHKKWFHCRLGSSDTKDIENYLKFTNADDQDVEAYVTGTSPVATGA